MGTEIPATMPAFIVADDHPMVRDAISLALRTAFPGSEIAVAGSFAETMRLVEAELATDLLILDLDMPGMQGLAGLAALRAARPTTPIAIVSATKNPLVMRQVIELGAAGFVPKFLPAERFIDAVRAILAGEIWLPAEALDDNLPVGDIDFIRRAAQLTPQQHRVLAGIAEGKPNKIIAYEMQIGEPTVKAHVTEILRKLGVSSRTQAVIIAQRLSLDAGAVATPDA